MCFYNQRCEKTSGGFNIGQKGQIPLRPSWKIRKLGHVSRIIENIFKRNVNT